MNVVNVAIIVYIVVLIPGGIRARRCPADGVVGCWCSLDSYIECNETYTGEDIPGFREYNNIYDWVYISDTRITSVQSFILLHIQTVNLYLSYNAIETIHVKAFWTSDSNNTTPHTTLKYLYLHNNTIKYIKSGTFDPLINLEELYLFNNKLRHIEGAFILNLHKLTYIGIENNELTKLPTEWLPTNLKHLDFSGNAIDYLSSNTFKGAFTLYNIWLSLNNITIEYNTFINLTELTYIDIYPRNSDACTCKYMWYINTKVISYDPVCDVSNTNYTSTREYLKDQCEEHITDLRREILQT